MGHWTTVMRRCAEKHPVVNSLTLTDIVQGEAGLTCFFCKTSLSKRFTFITKFTIVTPFLINLSFCT